MRLEADNCYLVALENGWAKTFSDFLTDGINFEFTFTGSIPMRPIDVAAEWDSERARGGMLWAVMSKMSKIDNALPTPFIGTVGLYAPRYLYRSWEFRILLGAPGQLGRGIGTETARMVVNWGFRRFNAHKIWLGVNANNVGAIKCYEKVGFKREGNCGVLEDEIFCDGNYSDVIRMRIKESEWPS